MDRSSRNSSSGRRRNVVNPGRIDAILGHNRQGLRLNFGLAMHQRSYTLANTSAGSKTGGRRPQSSRGGSGGGADSSEAFSQSGSQEGCSQGQHSHGQDLSFSQETCSQGAHQSQSETVGFEMSQPSPDILAPYSYNRKPNNNGGGPFRRSTTRRDGGGDGRDRVGNAGGSDRRGGKPPPVGNRGWESTSSSRGFLDAKKPTASTRRPSRPPPPPTPQPPRGSGKEFSHSSYGKGAGPYDQGKCEARSETGGTMDTFEKLLREQFRIQVMSELSDLRVLVEATRDDLAEQAQEKEQRSRAITELQAAIQGTHKLVLTVGRTSSKAIELLETTIPDALRSLENRVSSVEQRMTAASAEASASTASLARAVAAATVGARVSEPHGNPTRAEDSTTSTTQRSRFTGKRRRHSAEAKAYEEARREDSAQSRCRDLQSSTSGVATNPEFLGRGLKIRPADIHCLSTEDRPEAAGANQLSLWSHNSAISQQQREKYSKRDFLSREASHFAEHACGITEVVRSRSRSPLSVPRSEHGQDDSFPELDSFNPLEEEDRLVSAAHTADPSEAKGRSWTGRYNEHKQPSSSLSGSVGTLLSTPSRGIQNGCRPRQTVSSSHLDITSLSPASPHEAEVVAGTPRGINAKKPRLLSLPRSEALLLPSSRANEEEKTAEQSTSPEFYAGARGGPNEGPRRRYGRTIFEDEEECSRAGSHAETTAFYGVAVDRIGASLPGLTGAAMGSKDPAGRMREHSLTEDGGLTVEAYMEKRRVTTKGAYRVDSTTIRKNNRNADDNRSDKPSFKHSRRPLETSDYVAKEPRATASCGSVSVDVTIRDGEGGTTNETATPRGENMPSLPPRLGTDSARSSDGWLLGGGSGW